MSRYVLPIPTLIKSVAAAATLPAPTVITAGGFSTTTWTKVGAGYPAFLAAMTADGDATVTDPCLWGVEPTTGLWGYICPLNSGGPITLSTTRAYYEQLNLPTVFSRLAIVGTVSANNVAYSGVPISMPG